MKNLETPDKTGSVGRSGTVSYGLSFLLLIYGPSAKHAGYK